MQEQSVLPFLQFKKNHTRSKINYMDFLEYFYNHLERIIKSTKALYYQPTQIIFLLVIKDYLEGKIDLHFITSAAAQLYYQLNKPTMFDNNNEAQDLGNILSIASEMEFYQKNQNNEKLNKKMYDSGLEKMLEYYETNKKLLNSL